MRPVAVTGAAYEAQLSRGRADRRARTAFRELAVRLAAPGTVLLDFGCGTGMDARFYAERGLRVRAYDADPNMCDYFEANCRSEILSGRVTLERGSYQSFLRQEPGAPGVTLVTANFAPLNLVENLSELFTALHALTVPGARVLASVLSPYFAGDLRYRWWWHNLPALIRHGHYSVAGAPGPIVRRGLGNLAAQAAPFFSLQSVSRDALPAALRGAQAARPPGRYAWLPLVAGRYMFLLFSRRDELPAPHRPAERIAVSRNDARSRA